MKRFSLVPPIALDRRQTRPVYGFLSKGFAVRVASCRSMMAARNQYVKLAVAAELRISRISVSNAYEQLQSEGYLETFAGSGTCELSTHQDRD